MAAPDWQSREYDVGLEQGGNSSAANTVVISSNSWMRGVPGLVTQQDHMLCPKGNMKKEPIFSSLVTSNFKY